MSKLITFEGIEGSGKSTQAVMLQQYFNQQKVDNLLTREPGGSKVGEEIRQILISGKKDKMDGVCEMLLNFAARRNHFETIIKPALENKTLVICDRFFDSTIAYQGFAQNVDLETISIVQKIAIGNFEPNMTFLIDLDVEMAFSRINKRQENNRYEQMDQTFHQQVRSGFLQIAKNNQNRIIKIDGNQTKQAIHQEIISFTKLLQINQI